MSELWNWFKKLPEDQHHEFECKAMEVRDMLDSLRSELDNPARWGRYLIAYAMDRTHRTHQQSTVKQLLEGLLVWARSTDTDLRNEATQKLMLELGPAIDRTPIPYV